MAGSSIPYKGVVAPSKVGSIVPQLQIEGVEELILKFNIVPQELHSKFVKPAVKKASKLVSKRASQILQSKTVRRTGNLYNSVGAMARKTRSKFATWETVTARRSSSITKQYIQKRSGLFAGYSLITTTVSGRYKGFHGHLIEYGHRILLPPSPGHFINRWTRPRPFMTPAWDSESGRAEMIIKFQTIKGILMLQKRHMPGATFK